MNLLFSDIGMMHRLRPSTKLSVLFAVHLILGFLLMMSIFVSRSFQFPALIQFGCVAFVASELLLLGTWVGLSTDELTLRLLGLFFGIGWLIVLGIAAAFIARPLVGLRDPLAAFDVIVNVVPVIVIAPAIAISFDPFRKLVGSIEWQDEWLPSPSQDLRFGTRTLIGLTTAVAAILGFGRMARSMVSEKVFVGVSLTVLVGAIGLVWLLTWALLSHGRIRFRLPFMFLGLVLLEFIPVMFLDWDLGRWLATLVFTAIFTSVSLLVVRSCGYRLVPIRSVHSDQAGTATEDDREGMP